MPNNLGELTQDEELLLCLDGRHNPAEPFNDNPDVTWETYLNPNFNHLPGSCHDSRVLVLSGQGMARVKEILLLNDTVIRSCIVSRLRNSFYDLNAIVDHMGFPYAEKHIKSILDAMVQDGSVQLIYPIHPPLYTVQ